MKTVVGTILYTFNSQFSVLELYSVYEDGSGLPTTPRQQGLEAPE